MATESPIRILEETDRWRNLKQSSRYGPSSAKKAIEGLDLFLRDQRFQSLEKDAIPSRSESAPPSMEGSLAAIENYFSHRRSVMSPDASLDKRSGGPLNSPMNNLPAHEEESEDDRSSEQSLSVSVKKASFLGFRSGSLDPTQEDSYYAPSPSYDAEQDLNAVKVDKQEKNPNIFSSSNSGSHKFHKIEQLVPQNKAQSSNSQIIYPGISCAYSNPNQFQYGSSNVSTLEVRPIPPLYAAAFMTPPNAFYPNLQPAGFFTPQYSMGGYNFSSTVLPSYLSGYPHQGAIFDGVSTGGSVHGYDVQNFLKFYGQAGVPLQPPFHMQYFQPPVRDSYSSYGRFNHQASKEGAVENQVSSRYSKEGADYKPQQYLGGAQNNLNLKRGNISSHYYFGSPRNNGNVSHSPSGNPSKANDMNQSYSFLEELKSGKGQRFELSDIVGHIVEFSVDQHGSRFIQQKLEICSVEEKASVFKEVVPHASKLMTDVFGNYVIQKLFEYGSPEQRKYLADQLEGQILPLSLQMYGCRVIQKALDVIDLEQKARLVKELDGHVIRCVRDQNGNHVIQKCIESIPTDDIHFIISSFRGQVAMLSMHPYGCRVIQRVLEHCHDDTHTQFIVDEILASVCSLAQDQYGNYVTQHVLERGKTRERREIMEKLGGSIVQLSQHKFASNVIEKCLEYSDSTSRGMLIKEIIGDADKNDNLLIMMKDQYANYVIQKIVEKCSSDQREVLLGLIRNHITALKKYTYGKHIVARFEQLYGDEIKTSG